MLGERVELLKKLPRHDISTIMSAFSSFPLPEDAKDEAERKLSIGAWMSLLDYEIKMVSEYLVDGNEHHRGPDSWDDWILPRIAMVILHLRPSENSSDFWIPILEWGDGATRLVERFFQDWFDIGLNKIESYPHFMSIWKKMIQHGQKSPNWDYAGQGSFRDLNRAWCALMGLDYLLIDRWQAPAPAPHRHQRPCPHATRARMLAPPPGCPAQARTRPTCVPRENRPTRAPLDPGPTQATTARPNSARSASQSDNSKNSLDAVP
jgi:hypothetical protein